MAVCLLGLSGGLGSHGQKGRVHLGFRLRSMRADTWVSDSSREPLCVPSGKEGSGAPSHPHFQPREGGGSRLRMKSPPEISLRQEDVYSLFRSRRDPARRTQVPPLLPVPDTSPSSVGQ